MTHSECSDRDRLQQLLNESLPEVVEGEVSAHLATCVQCQHVLESLAAEEGWWEEAGQRLSKSSSSAILLASESPPKPRCIAISQESSSQASSHMVPTAADDATSDEAFATDFAVDFLEPSDNPMMLGRLGEYEIVEVIGGGGMGIVLKGFQKELNRYVVVKVLAPHLATSGAARRRFAREAQATAAVVNPHVMAIHSVHASTKLPYLVMPFVACESLQQRLDRHGPLDLSDILRIGMQAAVGLAAAHAQGLVHRDIKPANILLETNVDRVMLTDFGLARAVDDATLTRTGVISGTPQYMSPEQANGDAVDHRSDLFSLGSVMYAMCTGRPPFRAETTFGMLRRIRETDPRPIREINPEIPSWLEKISLKLLAKVPDERIATATEVATILEQCLAHVQQPTTVALPLSVNPSFLTDSTSHRRMKTGLKLGLFGCLCVGAFWGMMSLFGPRDSPRTDRSATNVATEVQRATEPQSTNEGLEWNEVQHGLEQVGQALELLEFEAGDAGEAGPK